MRRPHPDRMAAAFRSAIHHAAQDYANHPVPLVRTSRYAFRIMKIVADENIPYVEEACGPLGTVVLRPGRRITPEDVRDANILLVRSVTAVNGDLLEGSRVRFVATATIGIDHIDDAYLAQNGIAFASAQGSNANSVAEYVLTALFSIWHADGKALPDQAIGVVGCGNVGRRVIRHLRRLGRKVLVCDPPLAKLIQTTGLGHRGETLPDWIRAEGFVDLETLLNETNNITLHVPLVKNGPHATRHLLDAARLANLQHHILLNTSRGAVVDNAAVGPWLRACPESNLVLDVWESEPNIRWKLLQEGNLRYVTPHIAGYSFDGKVAGTRMIYEALCRHLKVPPTWDGHQHLGEPGSLALWADLNGQDEVGSLVTCFQAACGLSGDDRRMRTVAELPSEQRAAGFDGLRKNYPLRREFFNYAVTLRSGRERLGTALETVGFKVNFG